MVTVEDVQSSLYYLHVDNADDDHFLTASDNAEVPQEVDKVRTIQGRDKENRPEVCRKPLQQKPHSVWGNSSESPSASYPDYRPTKQAADAGAPPKRKPLNPAARVEESQVQGVSTGAAAQSPARQLLGPRPFNTRAHILQREHSSAEQQLPDRPDRPSSTQTTLRAKSSPTPLGTAQPYLGLHRQGSNSWSNTTATNELSLTLIRRDPASGGQWNVGKILSVPLGEAVSNNGQTSPNKSTKPIRRPLDVEVRTPGYVKFKSAGSHTLNTSSPQNHTLMGYKQFELATNRDGGCNDSIFRRRIIFGQSNPPQYEPWEQRSGSSELSDGSVVSSESFDTSFTRDKHGFDDRLPASNREQPSTDRKSKHQGYTFLSPWNGTCEFITGVAGRSLICKHRLPAGIAAISPSHAVTVSELRFNLPSSALFSVGQSNASTQSASRKQNRLSFMSKYKHRRQLSSQSSYHGSSLSEPGLVTRGSSTDGSDADESKLDLSLGQEHAGGGFGGKQAKLGKLIIEDEGLKMLDLLVAANMALWWHAYDRCISP